MEDAAGAAPSAVDSILLSNGSPLWNDFPAGLRVLLVEPDTPERIRICDVLQGERYAGAEAAGGTAARANPISFRGRPITVAGLFLLRLLFFPFPRKTSSKCPAVTSCASGGEALALLRDDAAAAATPTNPPGGRFHIALVAVREACSAAWGTTFFFSSFSSTR